jgi:hypothetical protein
MINYKAGGHCHAWERRGKIENLFGRFRNEVKIGKECRVAVIR